MTGPIKHSFYGFARPNAPSCALAGAALAAVLLCGACAPDTPTYGRETQLYLPGPQREVWAVAPVINLSGQPNIDPLVQADLVYEQLQAVQGLTVIPVNRVAQTFLSLHIDQLQSPEQAALVMEQLGCDGLIVATITLFDPYDPPKFGGSIQLFTRNGSSAGRTPPPSPRDLVRQATPGRDAAIPQPRADFLQTVGMFDAQNGTVRDALLQYAIGRNDPAGPMGDREYLASMDRYCGFAYSSLIEELLIKLRDGR